MTQVVRRRSKPRLDVYTDGACSGAPGPGAWAWAADSGNLQGTGYEPSTTNQRMEMRAVIEALRELGPRYKITIMSDSAYVINCFQDRWYVGWKRNNWRNSQGKAVVNRDLWEELISLVEQHKPEFQKVKGHSGNAGNDFVDKLAVRTKNEGRSWT